MAGTHSVAEKMRVSEPTAASGGSLERRRQTTVGLSRTAIFCFFASYIFSEVLQVRPALLYSDTQSDVGFSVIPKCMTLNGYFALNFVFAQVMLALTVRLSKNSCVKTNKGRYTLSAAQTFGRECTL